MLLTKEESYENVKICCIYKEKFEDKYEKDKRILESQRSFSLYCGI